MVLTVRPFRFWAHISDSWFSLAFSRIVTLDAAVFPAQPGYGYRSDWPDLAIVQRPEAELTQN